MSSNKDPNLKRRNIHTLTSRRSRWAWFGVAALAAGGLLSRFASGRPDGLNRVAEDHGFAAKEASPEWTAWLSGYEVPGMASPFLKVSIAGAGGAVLLFVVLYGTIKLLARREDNADGRSGDSDAS